MKPIAKMSIAALAGALSFSMATSTAEASSAGAAGTISAGVASGAYLRASCGSQSGVFRGYFAAYYNIAKTGRPVFYRFTWYLRGPGIRKHNNVNIKIRRDAPEASDKTLWTWNSPDNIEPGFGEYRPPLVIEMGQSYRFHMAVQFIFDRPGPDTDCTAYTPIF